MLTGVLLGLTALGLSADAFAASLARGAVTHRPGLAPATRNGVIFGGVEGAMCLLGWLLASTFAALISAIDHWIALLLLGFIGGRMIHEAFSDEEDDERRRSDGLGLTLLTAIGTSIDSAVVGVALYLAGSPAWAALVVGTTSVIMSTLGFLLGPVASRLLGRRAEIAGGLILIGIGLSIWIDHVLL
ncbi:manganese efflux pump MntP [Wenzhouxiangella marina]|uniref:Putative manganese efflux pump MntP n=1 Tax=Wenzhouxiangella marina TaxID=1579979 RepID=A0A0K0XU20_9GAMM|nr:manganese efflux pump MntP family protein [Wenzhouxiangella marina]AKS41122.1 Putative manganese efflux pump MntP [Wenzhouxiangella marina]MBB6088001.1 putative Mn2+ efflux pump MntP [Wenzhouxiangella marina]